jgi:vitamin K-dependent gamma-carboxylase
VTRSAFLARLFEPVDIASLVFFRIAFGAIMVWEVAKYFVHGWIKLDYINPDYHFSYYGFGWVQQ